MASILYLVLGDLSAAIIGVSFGGDVVKHKIGRQGKKSAEGSFAMFLVCFVTGCVVFNEVHLAEYAVFISALVATLVELYEPFGLNDNLTIPVFSSLSLTWGLMRIHTCSNPNLTPTLTLTLIGGFTAVPRTTDPYSAAKSRTCGRPYTTHPTLRQLSRT